MLLHFYVTRPTFALMKLDKFERSKHFSRFSTPTNKGKPRQKILTSNLYFLKKILFLEKKVQHIYLSIIIIMIFVYGWCQLFHFRYNFSLWRKQRKSFPIPFVELEGAFGAQKRKLFDSRLLIFIRIKISCLQTDRFKKKI